MTIKNNVIYLMYFQLIPPISLEIYDRMCTIESNLQAYLGGSKLPIPEIHKGEDYPIALTWEIQNMYCCFDIAEHEYYYFIKNIDTHDYRGNVLRYEEKFPKELVDMLRMVI